MADPRGKDWSHLKSWMMQSTTYNGKVREYFSDVKEDDDFKTLPRAATRKACLIDSSDSAIIALHKRLNFYFEINNPFDKGEEGSYYQNIGIHRKHKPVIHLYFWNDAISDDDLIRGQISFRIMDDDFNESSLASAREIGLKIKSVFGGATPYKWKKGRLMFTYNDWAKGYQFQILAYSKTEAKDLVANVLRVQNHIPEWKYFESKENEDPINAFPSARSKKTVLGRQVETPIYRATGEVSFRYASIGIFPLKPMVLYSVLRSRASKPPLVE